MIKIALLVFISLTTLAITLQYTKTQIHKDWQMSIVRGPPSIDDKKSKTFKTSIPTTSHLTLQASGQIPNPLIKENYPTVKWVSDCDYLYTTNLTIPDQTYKFQYHKLTFEGIDTYGEIHLNNKKILTTENAFRSYSVYVTDLLKQGVNKLDVRINSTVDPDNQAQRKNSMPFQYAQTRKACYQYSWDWAPYLNTNGIWKNVYLQSFNDIKLDYVWVRTRSITKSNAVVNFAIALQIPLKQMTNDFEIQLLQDGNKVATFPVKEQYSYNDINVGNPKLWWPNGIGEPHIYQYTVQLFKKSIKTKIDQKVIPFGIRTVALDLENRKFQVKVNGYSVYCKGANYVPPDMFYPRLSNNIYTPGNTIQSLIQSAYDSNFNMIRVWGGGQYQSDKFLQLASRKGIMLFYDFMFSDSIYPSTEQFLTNVEQQIKQQIRRARNYPALTLWSGNNQILQGIKDWGWGQQRYKDDYHRLFQVLIPKIIQYESPYIPYIPSSPLYGVGNYGFERGGDVHYWGVWAGSSAFQTYQTSIGKFNSQFGTQSLPVWQTIIEGITDKPSYDSAPLLLHERHNSRFGTLMGYMNQYMKKSLNFELQTYQSGLLQAFAIELAIKAQRIAKPASFGTLYWQFNDAWPAISWSSIDYYGRWKPLQFMAKRLYPDVAIYTVKDKIYAVSDQLYAVDTLAVIKFFDLRGTLLKKIQQQVKLDANQVKMIHQISPSDYQGGKKEDCLIYTEIVAGKQQTMVSTHFNAKFKDLNLFPSQIQVQLHSQFKTMVIQTKTTIVKNLFISRKSKYFKTNNNYFDLVPGHPVKVTIQGQQDLNSIKDDLVFRSYREVYVPQSSIKVIMK